MSKRILWIEDDYFAIGGLMRPLKKAGYEIDAATSAEEAYLKVISDTASYDLIVVDLILPRTLNAPTDESSLPLVVRDWKEDEPNVGVGLIKWLVTEQKIHCPILLLSIVPDPVKRFGLARFGIAGCILKRGASPQLVKDKVLEIIHPSGPTL